MCCWCVIFDGCRGTFVRRVSPVWTGVGDSGVQTRFSSCRHPRFPSPPSLPPSLPPLPPSPPTDVAATTASLCFLWVQPVLTLNICPGGACSGLWGGGRGEKSGVGLKRTKFQIVPTMDVHTCTCGQRSGLGSTWFYPGRMEAAAFSWAAVSDDQQRKAE